MGRCTRSGAALRRLGERLSGDFHWPQIGLIVEADGWRHHRTAGEQATDHQRDQAHTAAGLTTLRFAESQIRFTPEEVVRRLTVVANRLASAPGAVAAVR
jgi:very-short-patch-repair endonuclease